MSEKLTHFDTSGHAIMVDITQKKTTAREAIAVGRIRMNEAALQAVITGTAGKGDVLGVARVAGIMAAKRTGDLIPLCHPLALGRCTVDFVIHEDVCEIEAICTASLTGQTGVEMEALTGAGVALLTLYDMCKAMDKRMEITGIHVAQKSGGKSGDFFFDPDEGASHA